MPNQKNISMSVIRRLPRYYYFLSELEKNDIRRISSKELAIKMGLTASQIRQDFNCFGGFGQQGYGYNVDELKAEISNILHIDKGTKLILIGAGNLGRAIVTHIDFAQNGFKLIGVFDKTNALAGQMVNGLPVRLIDTLEEFCAVHNPVVAVLTVPKEVAYEITPLLINLNIKALWNFSHADLNTKYPEMPIENVRLTDSLLTLSYSCDSENQ